MFDYPQLNQWSAHQQISALPHWPPEPFPSPGNLPKASSQDMSSPMRKLKEFQKRFSQDLLLAKHLPLSLVFVLSELVASPYCLWYLIIFFSHFGIFLSSSCIFFLFCLWYEYSFLVWMVPIFFFFFSLSQLFSIASELNGFFLGVFVYRFEAKHWIHH